MAVNYNIVGFEGLTDRGTNSFYSSKNGVVQSLAGLDSSTNTPYIITFMIRWNGAGTVANNTLKLNLCTGDYIKTAATPGPVACSQGDILPLYKLSYIESSFNISNFTIGDASGTPIYWIVGNQNKKTAGFNKHGVNPFKAMNAGISVQKFTKSQSSYNYVYIVPSASSPLGSMIITFSFNGVFEV